MKKSLRPLILAGFAVLCTAVLAGGWFFTQASDKRGLRTPAAKSASAALGTSLLTEDFSYNAGALLTDSGWTAHSGGGTNAIAVTSPGLTYPGYAGSGVGNAITMAANGEDASRTISSPVSSGSLYAAFMVNVSTSQTTGDYIFHYLTFGSTTFFRGRVFVRKDAETTNYAFGLSRGGADITYTGSDYTPGTTHLIVVKYSFVEGTANDVVQLFVDPTPGGTEPSATLTAGVEVTSDPTNLDAVALRQGSASNASTQQIDGIRVATTWEEAVASGGNGPVEPNGRVDLNGDGRTDFVIARPLGDAASVRGTDSFESRIRSSMRDRLRSRVMDAQSGLQGGSFPLEWWGLNNGAPGIHAATWGDFFTDDPVTADFDGDGKDDITVWRPAGVEEEAYYYSINSSDFTLRQTSFGQLFDNPYPVGDYDGDGIDDPAVYRCPIGEPGTCHFYYRGTLNNPEGHITFVPWGFGEGFDFLPYTGDFNGDGKLDFAIQGASPSNPDNAIFYIALAGSFEFSAVEWGFLTDRLVPGDYDGDGKTDIAVTREVEGVLWWYVLEQDGGMQFVPWGQEGDFQVPGDYNGDGRDDFAIYRWDETVGTFWVQPSDGSQHFAVEWGLPGDYPVAYFFVQ